MGLVAGVTRCLSSAVSHLPQGTAAARHSLSPHTSFVSCSMGRVYEIRMYVSNEIRTFHQKNFLVSFVLFVVVCNAVRHHVIYRHS